MVNPIVLSYSILKAIVSMTHQKVATGAWNSKTAKAFMRENGIAEKYSKSIVYRALNCNGFQLKYENREKEPEEWERIKTKQKENPELYRMAPIPAIWNRNTPLHLFIDTPMHLLFLGVVKAVFARIGEWSYRAGRGPAFTRIAKTLLTDVDNLKLQWLSFNVKTFGGKWGGWVAEKYQSLARIALWVYAPLMLIKDGPEFVEPDNNVSNWFAKDYQTFLRIRGLDYSGKKEVVGAKVREIMALPEDERPPVLPPSYMEMQSVLLHYFVPWY